jgi:hypothetical protein
MANEFPLVEFRGLDLGAWSFSPSWIKPDDFVGTALPLVQIVAGCFIWQFQDKHATPLVMSASRSQTSPSGYALPMDQWMWCTHGWLALGYVPAYHNFPFLYDILLGGGGSTLFAGSHACLASWWTISQRRLGCSPYSPPRTPVFCG